MEIDSHLEKQRVKLCEVSDGISFLNSIKTCWEDYKLAMAMIRDILMYMVRPGEGSSQFQRAQLSLGNELWCQFLVVTLEDWMKEKVLYE